MVRLDEAKLTSQGQVSVPKKVREHLHLEAGCRVVFLEDGMGRIYIEEAERGWDLTPEQWNEFLNKSKKEKVTRMRGKAAALKHLDRLKNKPAK